MHECQPISLPSPYPCLVVPGLLGLGHVYPKVVWLGQVGKVLEAVGLEDADYSICAATEDEFLTNTEAGRQGNLWKQRRQTQMNLVLHMTWPQDTGTDSSLSTAEETYGSMGLRCPFQHILRFLKSGYN